MSRPVIWPLRVGATAPETLSLLQQRLLVAEEQTEALVQEMGSLGVPPEPLLEPPFPSQAASQSPVSPVQVRRAFGGGREGVLWRNCEALVGRVCRLESLLHTLKLTVFRLETERELNPTHSASLMQQLSALQQEKEEEQRSAHREVMRVHDQLRQASQDREEALERVQRLEQALEVTTSSKMDVALAAEELKVVKVQMTEKLLELKERLSQETTCHTELRKSHSVLLQRLQEVERALELERRQGRALQVDCRALERVGQEAEQRFQGEAGRAQQLEEQCQQLRSRADTKESLVSQLTDELKKLRQENSRLLKDSEDLRAAAKKVQALNEQMEGQCSELSTALCSLTVENTCLRTEHHASLKAEQDRVTQQLQEQDLLLDAARRNIQSELQRVLADKLSLQQDLQALQADHALLQQSSTVAQETAVTQRELLERAIERLSGKLNAAVMEGESIKRARESIQAEMHISISKLEEERTCLKSQLSKAKNAQKQVEQILQSQIDSKNQLAYDNGKLQSRLEQLQEELQTLRGAHSDSNQHQKLITVLESKYTQIEPLHKALEITRLDNKKLSQSLEQALVANSKLQSRLSQAEDQQQSEQEQHLQLLTQRETELSMARAEAKLLAEHLDTVKEQLRKGSHSVKQTSQEVAETKKGLKDALSTSADLSRANRELREKVNELKKTVSNQKSQIKEQKTQLKQHLDNRAAFISSKRVKELEAELKARESLKVEYEKKNYEQSQLILQFRTEMLSLQRELQWLSSGQEGELESEREQDHALEDKCLRLEESVRQLQWSRDKAELRLQETQNNRGPMEPQWGRWTSTMQRWEAKRELAHISGRYKQTRQTETD